MRNIAILLIALFLVSCGNEATENFTGPSHQKIDFSSNRPLVITDSGGGEVGPSADNVRGLRESGREVRVNGRCDSSCTMFLAVACYTDRAVFRFHGPRVTDRNASIPKHIEELVLERARNTMRGFYPAPINDWLSENNGLYENTWKTLRASDLDRMIPEQRCEED